MKTILITFAATLLYFNYASSQGTLPPVPKTKIKNCSINSYTPRGEFKKMFPNFLIDGQYAFDYDYVIPSPMGLDYDGFYGLYKFNNYEYPALQAKTSNTLSDLGKIVVQFTTSSLSLFRLDHDNYINSKTAIDYPDIYDLNSDSKASYNKMNTLYKETITRLLQSKNGIVSNISDLGTLDLETSTSQDDLVFQFVYIQSNTWMQGKTAEKFPSHSLYKLLVKTTNGDTLTTYGQAIFFEGDHGQMSRPKLTEHFVFATTFPIVFENLVSRFLNDTKTVDQIKKTNESLSIKMKDNENFTNIVKLKNQYNLIRSKKEQIKYDLAALGASYDVTAASIQGTKEGMDQTTNIFGANGASAIGNFVAGLIMKSQQKAEMAKNNQKLTFLKQKIDAISMEEKKFIETLPTTSLSQSDLALILNSKDLNNLAISRILTELSKKQGNVSSQLSETYSAINFTALNDFYSSINTTLNTEKIEPVSGTSSESLAITNAGATSKTMDICQQQATAAWYKSEEYKTYMRTKLNSDASDCKAKLIELTVQYCRGKLPANELETLKKTAAGERRVADDLRR